MANVDYRKLYNAWLRNDAVSHGCTTIDVQSLLPQLLIREVITCDEQEFVTNETGPTAKIAKLFLQIMPPKGEFGFENLTSILKNNHNSHDAATLLELRENEIKEPRRPFMSRAATLPEIEPGRPFNKSRAATLQPRVRETEIIEPRRPFTNHEVPKIKKIFNFVNNGNSTNLFLSQCHLKEYLLNNCEYIAKFWNNSLKQSLMNETFVNLELLTNKGGQTGTAANSYRDVFRSKNVKSGRYKRIIIEGDPGYGKSTYANKMAIDWANDDKYLNKKFEFVFLFELRYMTGVEKSLYNIFPPELHDFVIEQFNQKINKVLLIFDGFDEMDQSLAAYIEFQAIMDLKKYTNVTCIVTTRRSHIDKIPTRAIDQRLFIKGFTPMGIKDFMRNQGCKPLDEEKQKMLESFLKIPLFCAIFCSLRELSPQLEITNFFDLIKELVDASTKLHVFKNEQKWTDAQIQRDYLTIGRYAISKMDNKTLNAIKAIDPLMNLINTDSISQDLEHIQLGLIIKKNIPTGRFKEFRVEHIFPHQLFAEYFAAHYFTCNANLEEFDPRRLEPYMDIPFVLFLLRNISTKWSEINYLDSCVQRFLAIPSIRLLWICSSKVVAHSPDVCVRIWLTTENNSNFVVLSNEFREVYEVSQYSRLDRTGKPIWWRKIEKIRKQKLNTIMILTIFQSAEHEQKTLQQWLQPTKMHLIRNHSQYRLEMESSTAWQNFIKLSESKTVMDNHDDFFKYFRNFKTLKAINLENCRLEKTFIENILIQLFKFGDISQLENLNLSHNSNIGDYSELFACLSKCRNLKFLNLKSCNISSKSLTALVSAMNSETFENVEYLNLSMNSVIGANKSFFYELKKCPNLKTLKLESCSISSTSLVAFLECLENLIYFENINFSSNSAVQEVGTFFSTLIKNGKMKSIKLRNCFTNSISKNNFEIKNFNSQMVSNLKYLDVSQNNLTNSQSMFKLLSKCCQLKKLNISNLLQQISSKGDEDFTNNTMAEILKIIQSNALSELTYLNIGQNQLPAHDLVAIFRALIKCPNIKKLDVSGCYMSKTSADYANAFNSDLFKKLTSINIRDIQFNPNISDVQDKFFTALYNCETLKNVDFRNCRGITEQSKLQLNSLEKRGCTVIRQDMLNGVKLM